MRRRPKFAKEIGKRNIDKVKPYLIEEAAEEDILYDDITAGLLVSEVRRHRQELFEQLQLFYRVFVLKEEL